MAASSSSNPGEEYPYPSHVCAPNFVTVKLSGRELYGVWKTQMLCLLKSHDMFGFVDGTLRSLPAEDMSVLGKQKDMLWRRSDALATGWILGSLSEQTLKGVVNLFKPKTDFTAKDIWDQLQTIYGPLPPQEAAAGGDLHSVPTDEDFDGKEKDGIEGTGKEKKMIKEGKDKERNETEEEKKKKDEKKKKEQAAERLYEATLCQDFREVKFILNKKEVTLTDKITINGNTALHVAVGTSNKNKEFLEKMLNLATQDEQQRLNMKNSDGSTLLHVAAIVGNTQAARMLVEKDQDLIYYKDNEDQYPLTRALSNMHKDTYAYLVDQYVSNRNIENGDLFDDTGFRDLLVNIISSKDYGSAISFLYEDRDKFLCHIDTVLVAIAQNFPPKLNNWERVVCRFASLDLNLPILSTIHQSLLHFRFIEDITTKGEAYWQAKRLLKKICYCVKDGNISHHDRYNDAIFEATRKDAHKFVKIIVSEFPNAICCTNENGDNIIQYAVRNRSGMVYNLLYQMSEHKNYYKTIRDSYGNNLLHLAAKIAPSNKLDPISGAALQIQFELQWFKEVERFVCPLNIIQENNWEDTPQMVFTEEHEDLVTKGEKWMKETAQSYTITAALITTIVFAAAITVPGGSRQENGIPVFTSNPAFTIFAVSDAISLFTSVTSLLMFLSILTARFSEQDFLFKLPTKLIIGLTTLFISTTAMLVAFGATLFLLFGQNNSQILGPIVALTCLPITCFMTLQFPLIYDLMSATYGRSMFGKKSDKPFY